MVSHGLDTRTAISRQPGIGARPAGLLARLAAGIRTFATLWTRRTAFGELARLDDRMLEDIGLRRTEIETAARLPLSVNASLAVRQMADERRAAEARLRRR